MDPLSQAAVGGIAAGHAPTKDHLRPALLVGALAGMAPDLDAFIFSVEDPLLFLEYHRQFTHSLVFIPIGAAIVALVCFPFVRHRLTAKQLYLACLAGYATHGLLDACTSYGTQLFWPFTNFRVTWNNVSIVDPLFTIPLSLLLITAAIRKSKLCITVATCWALSYLTIGAIQSERASKFGYQVANHFRHEGDRLIIKATMANLVLWKLVYEHEETYHVHALRTGFLPMSLEYCGGDQVVKVALKKQFPWLAEETQQYRDVHRFAWFSEDYIGVSNADENWLIDVRYSMMPNSADGMWGVQLSTEKAADEHIEYVVQRNLDGSDFADYWAMIEGSNCQPLEEVPVHAL